MIWRPFVVLILIWTCRCATLSGTEQKMRVGSIPEGADVYVDEKKMGTTPTYIDIRRAKHKALTFKKDGYVPQTVELKTGYRWGDSIFANVIFLWAAPVGWAVDYL